MVLLQSSLGDRVMLEWTCVISGLEPKAPWKTLEKGTAVCSLQERTRMRREEEASDPTSAAAQMLRLQDCLSSPSLSSTR